MHLIYLTVGIYIAQCVLILMIKVALVLEDLYYVYCVFLMTKTVWVIGISLRYKFKQNVAEFK